MSELYVYVMRSRNKDNRNVEGFKERMKTILEYKENEEKVIAAFEKFASEGLPGEKTRLYRTVNARNEEKIREELIIYLLRNKPSMTKLNGVLASVAQQTENRAESKWLFDFDIDDEKSAIRFISDISSIIISKFIDMKNTLDIEIDDVPTIEKYKTPNGYAIIVSRGFDVRKLAEKWDNYNTDITLHKDALLFLDMKEKK